MIVDAMVCGGPRLAAWVVRTRPDDLWKARAPPAASLPRDVVTTGTTWPWFTPLQHWARTNFSAMDDHFMAAPRRLADRALKHALSTWFDCRPFGAYAARCPPHMLYYMRDHGLASGAVLTSEWIPSIQSVLRSHVFRGRASMATRTETRTIASRDSRFTLTAKARFPAGSAPCRALPRVAPASIPPVRALEHPCTVDHE